MGGPATETAAPTNNPATNPMIIFRIVALIMLVRSKSVVRLNHNNSFLGQPQGYVIALEKSTSPVLTLREVYERLTESYRASVERLTPVVVPL